MLPAETAANAGSRICSDSGRLPASVNCFIPQTSLLAAHPSALVLGCRRNRIRLSRTTMLPRTRLGVVLLRHEFLSIERYLSASGDNSTVYQARLSTAVIPQPEMRGKDEEASQPGSVSGDGGMRAAMYRCRAQRSAYGPRVAVPARCISSRNPATCPEYSSWYRSLAPGRPWRVPGLGSPPGTTG